MNSAIVDAVQMVNQHNSWHPNKIIGNVLASYRHEYATAFAQQIISAPLDDANRMLLQVDTCRTPNPDVLNVGSSRVRSPTSGVSFDVLVASGVASALTDACVRCSSSYIQLVVSEQQNPATKQNGGSFARQILSRFAGLAYMTKGM